MDDNQKVLCSCIFENTGKTFQELAEEIGMRCIPDHISDLSDESLNFFISECIHLYYLKSNKRSRIFQDETCEFPNTKDEIPH